MKLNFPKHSKGFHQIEFLIWLVVLFIFLGGILFSKHFKKPPTPVNKESKTLVLFWKQLNQKAQNSNGKNTTTQEVQDFQNKFFDWAQVTQDPNQPFKLLKPNGTPAKPKGLLCELHSYNPNQPFIKPVCEL